MGQLAGDCLNHLEPASLTVHCGQHAVIDQSSLSYQFFVLELYYPTNGIHFLDQGLSI